MLDNNFISCQDSRLKYNAESNIQRSKDDDVKLDEKLSEANFVIKLNRIKSSSGLDSIFKTLVSRDVNIAKKETWELLLDKTESIEKSIDRMFAYFKHLYYPSASYWSSNSHSAYYALAAILRKQEYRNNLFDHLKDHCGHDSYSELIKAYSVNNDKKNSILLFERFVKICHLLVH